MMKSYKNRFIRRIKRINHRLWRWLLIGVLTLLCTVALDGKLLPVWSATSAIPTQNWQGAPLPDWNRITFNSLPSMGEGGAFDALGELQQQLGYDSSRTWQPGDIPSQYLKLGDFEESFALQERSVIEIASAVGLDLNTVSLDQFEAIAQATLGSLIEAIPDLAAFPLQQIPPVFDLLSEQVQDWFEPEQTLGEFLTESPHLADLGLNSLDLSQYGFADIPGSEQVPLGAFRNWRNSAIAQVPGLGDLPWSQFPNPPQPVGSAIGTVDVVFGPAEQNRDRTITGSDQVGFRVPCQTDCAHVELSGDGGVLGRQWISGKFQEVNGGFGVLGSVNGGVEPVGRHPFGDAFKVVVWDVSETEGRADTALFFRICQRGIPDLGCTPYFIGPMPWIQYREGGNDVMFLGALDTGTANNNPSTPTGAASNPINTFGKSPREIENLATLPGKGSIKRDCSLENQGVKLDALSQALAAIEGNYDSVGAYTCSALDCGRALGALQFMSYREDVRSLIQSKPGGEAFLNKLGEEKATFSAEEVLYFFPPAEQEALFRTDATDSIEIARLEIDPVTGRNFEGDRLIERVAQMHYGGAGIAIDSPVRDLHGRLSVADYGREAAAYYRGAVEQMGCGE